MVEVVERAPAVEWATSRIEGRFRVVRGATQLVESYSRAPLKIAKTFPHPDGSLTLCTMDCSPGLLAGDCYELNWHLEQGAHVFLTNQSFTRVHPTREAIAQQCQCIHIETDAVLQYQPEPVMLFRDATLHSECVVNIEAGGTLLMSDVLCAGRIARGEVFQFRQWKNRLHVHYDGELIFCNQNRLEPQCQKQQRRLQAPAGWGDYTHWGNFYVFSDRLKGNQAEQLVDELRGVMEHYPTLRSGASQTYRYGVAVSILGHQAWEIQQAIQRLHEVTKNWVKAPTLSTD